MIEEGDAAELAHALGSAAKARRMSEVAKAAGVTREALYKALRPNSSPRFDKPSTESVAPLAFASRRDQYMGDSVPKEVVSSGLKSNFDKMDGHAPGVADYADIPELPDEFFTDGTLYRNLQPAERKTRGEQKGQGLEGNA